MSKRNVTHVVTEFREWGCRSWLTVVYAYSCIYICLTLSFPSPVLFKFKWLICDSNALCIKPIMFHPLNPNLFYWLSLPGTSLIVCYQPKPFSQLLCKALRVFTFPQGYISVSFETSHRNLSMVLYIVFLFRRWCHIEVCRKQCFLIWKSSLTKLNQYGLEKR